MSKIIDYHEAERNYIGSSDIATLILVGFGEKFVISDTLHFGSDGTYYAYIVKGSGVVIDSYYKKVASFSHWLKIYDDDELVVEYSAKEINVYRAGEYGCIIQLLD